jgi:hypothetical protein
MSTLGKEAAIESPTPTRRAEDEVKYKIGIIRGIIEAMRAKARQQSLIFCTTSSGTKINVKINKEITGCELVHIEGVSYLRKKTLLVFPKETVEIKNPICDDDLKRICMLKDRRYALVLDGEVNYLLPDGRVNCLLPDGRVNCLLLDLGRFFQIQ